MCTSPIYMNIRRRCFSNGDYTKVLSNVPVPCGQCYECVKKRQTQYVVKVDRESKQYPKVFFVTLTYNEATLPVARSLWRVDKTTGDLSCQELPAIIDRKTDNTQYLAARSELASYPVFPNSPRHFFQPLYEDEQYLYKVAYSDSVCPSDVQKLFKRFRRWYEYRYKSNLDFRYVVCSEYGENFHRAHYHVLLMFKNDIDYPLQSVFSSLWNFGNVRCDKVSIDTLGNVSRYVSKYMFKPHKKSLGFSYCLPTRVRSSISFGSRIDSSDTMYYRAYDVFGTYSIIHFNKSFNNDEKQKIFETIFRRLSYSIDSFGYSLPLSFKRRLFGFRLRSGNFVWSPLYFEFTRFVKDRLLERDREDYENFCSCNAFEVQTFDSFVAFERYKETVNSIREVHTSNKMRKDYAKSIF